MTNANVSHLSESPRRTLQPRAAAMQQPRLQTTSRARRATSVPAESQSSQRQQLLPKRTLQPTQESAEGRRSTTLTATQRAAPSTARQQRSTSPTALARRRGSTRNNANSSASASTSRKSVSSPPAVRTTRAERLRWTQDNAPPRRSSPQQHQAGPSRIRSPATTYAEATRGQTSPRASVTGEDIDISRASPTVTATGSMAAKTSIAATLTTTTTTTTVSVCSGSIASAVSRPTTSMACQRPEEVQVLLPSQTPALSARWNKYHLQAAILQHRQLQRQQHHQRTRLQQHHQLMQLTKRTGESLEGPGEEARRQLHPLPSKNVEPPERPKRHLRRDNGRRGGRTVASRGPTVEQTALTDLACLATDAQQLEHTATLAAEYLSRFTERRARGPAGGGRRNRRANDARGRQRNGDDPAAGAGNDVGPITREGWAAAAAS
ncbi:unnamed protein product [Trichogramma brassicae]|uniref:Uncharacterized protein n=1 Tax=Trichogramma brassicae TaxID=86971 RepID=A0A6H5HSG3_9HYME|nr:unnamed protein product [Trichogramma brassicae]